MTLRKIDDDVFVDVTTIRFVRFEESNQDVRAIVRFNDGESETFTGEAARNLRKQLNGLSDSAHKPTAEGYEGNAPVQSIGPSGYVNDTKNASANGIRPALNLGGFMLKGSAFLGRNKAWFHRVDDKGRAFFLAFVNAKGSCSLRTFDADSGINRGKLYRTGSYHEQFANLIEGATELTVTSQPNLERDCKDRLPPNILAELRSQIAPIQQGGY